jgi:hypothetical protein
MVGELKEVRGMYIEMYGKRSRSKPHSLRQLVAEDEVVAKRGKPSLPKLKFMEGLGPEDPRYDADARAA